MIPVINVHDQNLTMLHTHADNSEPDTDQYNAAIWPSSILVVDSIIGLHGPRCIRKWFAGPIDAYHYTSRDIMPFKFSYELALISPSRKVSGTRYLREVA
jgi:hypothetical protein